MPVRAEQAIAAFLSKMREGLGERGRPNVASRWYAKRHDDSFLEAPWCDMRVTWAAHHSGNYDAVCFGTDYAYTVAHASAFERRGRWTFGTDGIRPGDVIFFDWNGRGSIGGIDHVGVVEKALAGGRVQTIEGNTSDALQRKVRSPSVITGYGRPDWGRAGGGEITLQKGDSGPLVSALQQDLLKVGQKLPKWGADGDFGDETVAAVKAFQQSSGFTGRDLNGVAGPKTRAALDKALKR